MSFCAVHHAADDVPVTQALLALVTLMRRARDFYQSETEIAELSGRPDPKDCYARCDDLYAEHANFARRVGLSIDRETCRALLDMPIPLQILNMPYAELVGHWVFNPFHGFRRI